MFRPQDWLLIGVTFSSILTGIIFPRLGAAFIPLPKYCMMVILFLSFLSISIADLKGTLQRLAPAIARLTFTKLVLLPVGVFFFFRVLLPEYALSALLLSGISTGVVAPFFAGIVNANTPLVLVMVVVSSVLVPFTLPFLVKILAGRTLEISLLSMVQLLAAVVLLPFLLAETFRRLTPRWVRSIANRRYTLSLILFVVTNLGIFSKYADFFRQKPGVVLTAVGTATLLAALYFGAGLLYSLKKPLETQLSVILSFGIMNNVLVMVFGAEFFSPLEPTVAAAYTIPFYGLILPLRLYQSHRSKIGTDRTAPK